MGILDLVADGKRLRNRKLQQTRPPASVNARRSPKGSTVVGLPAMSVPAGFTAAGLPVGMQIVGRARREDQVIRAAAAFEAAHPWAQNIPPTVAALAR